MSLTEKKRQDRSDTRLGCLVTVILGSLIVWYLVPDVPLRIRSAYAGLTLAGTGPDLSAETKQERLNEYFREGNTNAVQHRLGEEMIVRNVSSALRRAIIERDGGKCVICGLTEPLEVEHTRALENGGDNDPDNLATLCRNCHGLKTPMDKSLRRQRKRASQAGE